MRLAGVVPAHHQGGFVIRGAAVLTLGFVVAAAALALAIEPLTAGECITIEGVITAVDYGAQQIVVNGVTIQASARTLIKTRGDVIPFDYLQVGMTVKVCGLWEGDVLNANRINVKHCGG